MRFLLLLAFAVAVALPAAAQAPASEVTPIQAILDNPIDDQRVTIQGEIVRRVDDDDYIVRDSTGEIRVDIDDDLLRPSQVHTGMMVEIYGEVEIDDGRVEIEADRVTRIE